MTRTALSIPLCAEAAPDMRLLMLKMSPLSRRAFFMNAHSAMALGTPHLGAAIGQRIIDMHWPPTLAGADLTRRASWHLLPPIRLDE